MSEESIVTRTPAKQRRTWIIRGVLWSFVILLFSVTTGCTLLLETPFHFLVGWYLHATKALPPLLEKWQALLLPAGCLFLAGILIHRFICRCLAAKGKPLRWRPANTVASLALVLLGCGAAIALSGVVHQAVWLLSDRWIEDRGKRAEQTQAVSNARQLMLALHEYHESAGHYPNSLQELESTFPASPALLMVKTETTSVAEPFIFLKPGGSVSTVEVEPVIISPIFESAQKIVVGYSDGSVSSLPTSRLGLILSGGGNLKTKNTPKR